MCATQTLKPLLLTGAAGTLGGWLRPHLAKRPEGLRSSDIRPIGQTLPGEEFVCADLADPRAVERLVAGAGAVVHLGAIGVEDSFERILEVNIQGTYHVFDAARRHGVKRIVYASSIHVVGYYATSNRIDNEAPLRPDSYYAVSKCFGEALARLYVDKAAMEIACLRIGVVLPRPKALRNLWTWLSIPDLRRLVDTCLDAPRCGFAIIYGISNNRRSWWDNAKSGLDYSPQDDAEVYADQLMTPIDTRDPEDPGFKYHGGPFVALSLGQRPR